MQPTGYDSIKAPQVCWFGFVFFLTLVSSTSALNIPNSNEIRNIFRRNPLHINNGPAPSPENGPPLSAGALRDKKLLPAEIGGIVGAYLFSLCIIAIALLTCARKSRQRALLPRIPVDVEMIVAQPKPKPISIHPSNSVKSPGSPRNFSWPSPDKDERNPYIFPNANRSPITPPGSDPYVDSRIVQHDKEMAARNLEEIYAHVMEQEDAKANGINPNELPSPVVLQRPGSIPSPAPQRSAASPRKLDKSRRPSNITLDDNKSTKSRTSSILSALSPRRKTHSRTLQISSPLPTPKSASFPDDHGDREPLSPKYYKPPPPVPTDQVPYSHSRNNSNNTPVSPTRSIAEQLAPYGPGGPGNQSQRHRPYPSVTSIQSTDPISATSTTPLSSSIPPSKRGPPSVVTLHPVPTASNPPSSTNASARTLPFRQYEPSIKSPSFKPSVKTTVLERAGPQHSGPMTGGLRTPWTAGAVPYSPYQPQTPMIAVTPRLVTKEDRKIIKKQEKKMGAVQELVTNSDDLWDSGY